MTTNPASAIHSQRESRDEVHYRGRAMRRDGTTLPLLIVNLSPHGLMARSDEALGAGERLTVSLPVVGVVRAEIRWALGGRIGCQLDAAIPNQRYYELLAAMTR